MEALRGSDHIIHGGDIGRPEILSALSEIAPVTAVRGNNDEDDWAENLPETARLQFEGIHVYVIHDLKELQIEPGAAGIAAVISGHSHKPSIQEREGVLYINPGSAGLRRFKLPVTVAELLIEGSSIKAHVIPLEQQPPQSRLEKN